LATISLKEWQSRQWSWWPEEDASRGDGAAVFRMAITGAVASSAGADVYKPPRVVVVTVGGFAASMVAF